MVSPATECAINGGWFTTGCQLDSASPDPLLCLSHPRLPLSTCVSADLSSLPDHLQTDKRHDPGHPKLTSLLLLANQQRRTAPVKLPDHHNGCHQQNSCEWASSQPGQDLWYVTALSGPHTSRYKRGKMFSGCQATDAILLNFPKFSKKMGELGEHSHKRHAAARVAHRPRKKRGRATAHNAWQRPLGRRGTCRRARPSACRGRPPLCCRRRTPGPGPDAGSPLFVPYA